MEEHFETEIVRFNQILRHLTKEKNPLIDSFMQLKSGDMFQICPDRKSFRLISAKRFDAFGEISYTWVFDNPGGTDTYEISVLMDAQGGGEDISSPRLGALSGLSKPLRKKRSRGTLL